MSKFNVIQYREFLGDETVSAKKKHGSLATKIKPLAENVSLEEAISVYQGYKHREGLSYDEWFTTIKIEYNTSVLED